MTEDRGPQVAAVVILFLILAWVAVSLRVYVRGLMMKNFGTDDWLAVASLALFTLYCTFALKAIEYGTGQHLANIPPEHIPIALMWWWSCELGYVSCTTVLKASIAIFLLRICIKPAQKMTIWIVMGVVVLFSTFYFFLVIFQCSPVTYFWTQYKGAKGKCLSSTIIANATYAHSAVSAAADWTLGTLPIFLVWNLHMNPRTKVSVAMILALGAIGSTATVVRIPYIKQLTTQGDFLYSTTDVSIWSTVEPGIGITAAAMATLRPLFRTFLSRSKLMGSTSKNQSESMPWPSSRKQGRGGYFRSGSGPNNGAEELGLRGDIVLGVGVTTVIKSTNGPDWADEEVSRPGKIVRSSSRNVFRKNPSAVHVREDSSEEILTSQNNRHWSVRKTTEVRTSDEARRKGPAGPESAV